MRFVARGAWVSLLLLVHGAVWLIGWLALLVAFRGRDARGRWFARMFTRLLISLGATFVQVGAVMSTQADLFPPHITNALEKLQDDVGAFSLRHVHRTILEDF